MKALFALLLSLAMQLTWAESSTSAVANEVTANRSWAGELEKCPAELFTDTGSHAYDHKVRQQCTTPSSQGACLAACKSGKGEYCYWLGTALQGPASPDLAAEILFQRACKLGVASGCTNHAAAMLPQPPVKVAAQSCPARTFERTCAANDPWGCSMLGFILGQDKANARNRQRALEALKKSCRFGEEDPACRAANGIRKDLQ